MEDISAIAYRANPPQPAYIEDAIGDRSGDEGAQHQRTGEQSNQGEQPSMTQDSVIHFGVMEVKPVNIYREGAHRSDRQNDLRRPLHLLAMGTSVEEGDQRANHKRVETEGRRVEDDSAADKSFRHVGHSKDARARHQDDAGDADGYKFTAIAHRKYDPWPQQVELLFDAERPEVTKPEIETRIGSRDQVCIREGANKVIVQMRIEKTQKVAEVERPRDPLPCPCPMHQWRKQEDGEKNPVVQRKNAQGAADIEVADAVRVVPRVIEDAGDEKAREHEKNVDTGPPIRHAHIVPEKDAVERHRAQSIEGWEVCAALRQGVFG